MRLIHTIPACAGIALAALSVGAQAQTSQPAPVGTTQQTANEAQQRAVPRSDTGTLVRTGPTAADAARNATPNTGAGNTGATGTGATSGTTGTAATSAPAGSTATGTTTTTTTGSTGGTNATGTTGMSGSGMSGSGMSGTETATGTRRSARADRG